MVIPGFEREQVDELATSGNIAVSLSRKLPNMSVVPREAIPEAVKRQVRQHCGFGCVICGFPFYHYDHMVEYSKVKEHDPANITLLCGRHHDEKTRHHLPLEVIEKWNNNPKNRSGTSTAQKALYYATNTATANIGGMKFHFSGQTASALRVRGVDLISFRFEDGVLQLSFRLYNSAGDLLVQVVNNELVHSTRIWDARFEGTTLSIKASETDSYFVADFRPPRVTIVKGSMCFGGYRIECSRDKYVIHPGNNTFSGGSIRGFKHGVVVGEESTGPTAIFIGGSGLRELTPQEARARDVQACVDAVRSLKLAQGF